MKEVTRVINAKVQITLIGKLEDTTADEMISNKAAMEEKLINALNTNVKAMLDADDVQTTNVTIKDFMLDVK